MIGALLLDFFFIKPYGTLSIGSPKNWIAPRVYFVVVALVARVVADLNTARLECTVAAREHAKGVRALRVARARRIE